MRKYLLPLFLMIASLCSATITVTTSSPANGASTGVNISFSASATTTDRGGAGWITGWRVYLDGNDISSLDVLSCTAQSGPGSCPTDTGTFTAAVGTHTLDARAWDTSGGFGDSYTTFTVSNNGGGDTAITITINSPANNANVTSTVAFSATASTTDRSNTGWITGWRVYIDGVDQSSLDILSCTARSGSGSCPTDSGTVTLTTGSHTIDARAWDTSGGFNDSTVTVSVTGTGSPITVSVSSPTVNESTCSPLTVTATASSTAGSITGWQINNGNTMLWSGSGGSPLSTTLSLTAGAYNIGVKAWDSAGNSQLAWVNPVNIVTTGCSGGGGGGGGTGTTTLSEETGNNSGNAWFTGFTNGDIGDANISDVDMHNLLYTGNQAKIFPTVILFWCQNTMGQHVVSTSSTCRGHVEDGNNYDDPNDVATVNNDAINRHIDGMMLDWYGRGNANCSQNGCPDNFANQDLHAKNFVNDINGRVGLPLRYMFMLDHSYSYTCGNNVGASGTPGWQAMGYASETICLYSEIDKDADYLNTNYLHGSGEWVDPVDGRIPITVFITESGSEFSQANWTTVWNTVKAHTDAYSTKIDWVFENVGGLSHEDTGGAYLWIGNYENLKGAPEDEGLQDIIDMGWNSKNKSYSPTTWGGSWKGFNDSIASWGTGRLMDQKCGQTWLDTWAEWATSGYWGTSQQLRYVQPVTWSDYEEGTEIESGIDSCLTVSASLSSATVSWSVAGAGSTNNIDHFTVYQSTDGQTLTVLQDNIAAATRSLNLGNYSITGATTYLYVKMVAKSSMKNSMSGQLVYKITVVPPTASVSLSPTVGTVPFSTTANGAGSKAGTNPISTMVFNWGDGSSSTTVTASPWTAVHSYTVPGSYVVTNTVTDTTGLLSAATANLTANPTGGGGGTVPPTAQIVVSPNSGTAPLAVTANVSGSTAGSNPIASQTISWGDGSSNTVLTALPWTATHTFSNAGTYTVTNTVKDTGNLTNTATATVSATTNGGGCGTAVITNLSAGQYVYTPVRVQGTATSCSGNLEDFQVLVDGQMIWDTGAVGALTYTLDKQFPVSGSSYHTISVTGIDGTGKSFTSPGIQVYCVGMLQP